jgi:xylulokinase
VHASARVTLRPYESPGPGRWEHPEDDLWDSVATAIREALSRFTGDVSEIRGLGLCTIRFCRAVLRADGSLAQPVMSWMDQRVSQPFVQEASDTRFVTTSSGYLTHRLTGQFRDTAGNYQGQWPIDVARWAWSEDPESYPRTGLRRDLLFELVPPGEVLGEVTLEAARATGLPSGLPVIATSNDKAVEALGAGLRSSSEALISLGTYVSAMTTGAEYHPGGTGGWVNFGAEPGRYLFESDGVRRGMWTVSWFRDLLTGITEAELGRGAASVAPGAGGLLVSLDWLAPEDEPLRRGAIVGFDGTQGRFHIHRAILEALAVTVAEGCEGMFEALGRDLCEGIVTGGGASSDLMLEIMAAVFGVPMRRPAVTDAAGVGAAVTAAVATGLHEDFDAAVDAMVRPGLRVEPDEELVALYRGVRDRYRRVIPKVQRLFTDDEGSAR